MMEYVSHTSEYPHCHSFRPKSAPPPFRYTSEHFPIDNYSNQDGNQAFQGLQGYHDNQDLYEEYPENPTPADFNTHRPHHYQPYFEMSSPRTTYSGMNSWMKNAEKVLSHSAIPATQTDSSWKQQKALSQSLKSPYQPFEDHSRRDHYYNRYLQLSQNVAERYPDPGEPRERQGAIGGSWRHVKEVLGNTGCRTLFVDGLVSLYDMDINKMRSRKAPWERQISGSRYGITRHDVDGYKAQCEKELERKSYKPWENDTDKMPPINDTTQQLPGSPNKYKGFYTTR